MGFACGRIEIVGFERDCVSVMNEWVEIFCVRSLFGELVLNLMILFFRKLILIRIKISIL